MQWRLTAQLPAPATLRVACRPNHPPAAMGPWGPAAQRAIGAMK
jgi:hypothetical protein